MAGNTSRLEWSGPVLLTVVLTLLITAPLLAPGFVLGYDLVFVPDLTLRPDLFGVTTALPRAVPSDVLVALLDDVTGGQLLNKSVLLAAPLLAGLGMTALWRELRLGGPLAASAAVALYIWNPFVAERFRLGAWALLLGYAALPWLVRSALRVRRDAGWAGLLLAGAGCALTASGGITGLVVAALILLWPGQEKLRSGRIWPLGCLVLLNGPWLVAGLIRTSAATTDPASVTVFAARDEGYGGVLPTLLTLGGIWNADVVPADRGEVLPLVLAFVMLAVAVIGVVRWWRQDHIAAALVVAAALALVVGMAGVVVPDALAWLVANVPGAGLFRDGQRYLGPLVLLQAVGFGAAIGALLSVARLAWVVGVTAVLVPIAALPALAVGGGLRVSEYPADWEQARQVLGSDSRPGAFIPWPFETYRAPAWNGKQPVLDPMPRYFTRPSVAPDELVVAGRRLAGEDPRAAAVATALRAAATTGADPTPVLLNHGIGWLVVDRQAGGQSPRQLIPQLSERFAGPTVTVYRLNGTPARQPSRPWAVAAVMAAWFAAAAVLVVAVLKLFFSARQKH